MSSLEDQSNVGSVNMQIINYMLRHKQTGDNRPETHYSYAHLQSCDVCHMEVNNCYY